MREHRARKLYTPAPGLPAPRAIPRQARHPRAARLARSLLRPTAMKHEKAIYHVFQDPEHEGWMVRKEGDKDWSEHETREDALAEARRLAQDLPLGLVKFHHPDGRVVDESTYGENPRREPDTPIF
jgi:hypothetical protein